MTKAKGGVITITPNPRLFDALQEPRGIIAITAEFRRSLRHLAKKHPYAQVKEIAFWVIAMEESLVEFLWADSFEAKLLHYRNWGAYKERAWEEIEVIMHAKGVRQ